MKLADLVLDYDLYPRGRLDATHASHLAEALRAGAVLPPIIIDAKTRRIVDGFHRYRAHLQVSGPDAEVDVEVRDYPDVAALFLDAIAYNAGHGRALDRVDRVRCAMRAAELAIAPAAVAAALQMTTGALGNLTTARTARDASDQPVALKFPARHMAGRSLTEEQVAAQKQLGGNRQGFFVNQVIVLLEADLFDWSQEETVGRLWRLGELIAAAQARRAA